VDMVLLGVANAVIVVDLVSLFVGTRRTPYDRITGTSGHDHRMTPLALPLSLVSLRKAGRYPVSLLLVVSPTPVRCAWDTISVVVAGPRP
jgi:hypothetical protein